MTLILPVIASAQYGGYGNGGYNNNGDPRSVLKSLKREARNFQRQLDRDLDNSRYDGSNREDRLNDLAGDFRNAVNNLNANDFNRDRNRDYDDDDRYNNGRYGGNNNRNNQDLNRVFTIANQIERSLNRSGLSSQSRNIWSQIGNDLNYLSRYTNNSGVE